MKAVATVTLQVLEGMDKGRVFRELPIPVTIGREEGNMLRLNDERVSRFHAKIQVDGGDVIITDLDSTNGTRVNGNPVQIRRLRFGDQIGLGRSTLLFGSHDEISRRAGELHTPPISRGAMVPLDRTLTGPDEDPNLDFNLEITGAGGSPPQWEARDHDLPPLPQKMSPGQAARVAEIFDYLHQGLATALENIQGNEEATHVRLPYSEWQKIQAVQAILARYLRGVAEPDTLTD
jgi:pSer/pThr/pTyr-binding forkhead associated (FHA) protein